MNWDKAKNILIIFFLCVNLCLCTILVYLKRSDLVLSDTAIESTVELLNQHGITMADDDIIPKEKFKNQSYNLTAFTIENENMLEAWLGAGYSLSEENSSLYQYIYKNGNRQLTINKTGLLFYSDKSAVLASPKEEKEIESELTDKLKKFNLKDDAFYFQDVWFENGLYHCIISPMVNDTKIIGIQLEIAADHEEIISISENWFTFSGVDTFENSGLLDITAVLANMIFLEEKPTNMITEIFYAAFVPEDYINNKIVTATPVYVFQCTDGHEYIFDARSGELLVS